MEAVVLVATDCMERGEQLCSELRERELRAMCATRVDAFGARVSGEPVAGIVLDVSSPDGSLGTIRDQMDQRWPDAPVVALTPFDSLDVALEAVRSGAEDVLIHPVNVDELALTLKRRSSVGADVEAVSLSSREHRTQMHGLIGVSRQMNRLYDQIERVAATDATVLITGETGTGKELVARAIHARSRRCHGPFLAANFAAIPDALIESELFGHTRGAFTDARDSRRGLFVEAAAGTMLLDEIGEASANTQAKLLRALQERRVRPVGSNAECTIDARVIAATNRDLEQQVMAKAFREDLYYRLNVVQVHVPALRERQGDIVMLAEAFMRDVATAMGRPPMTLSAEALAEIQAHSWPGNVRELRNGIEGAVALAQGSCVEREDLPQRVRRQSQTNVIGSKPPQNYRTLAQMERSYIAEVLDSCQGKKSQAARVLGVDRKTLYRKLKAYRLADPKRR